MRGVTDRTRLLVLVLPVLLGLLGMHALAAPPGPSGVHHAPAVAAPSVPPAGTPFGTQGPSHPAPHEVAPGGAQGATHPGPHGVPHDGASHLLHLCLAVLAAGVVLAAAVLLSGVAPLPSSRGSAGPGSPRTAAAARPPPAPRRLALLCVSRT